MTGNDPAAITTMRHALAECARALAQNPGLSGSQILGRGRELLARKKALNLEGLFSTPPALMTATLDDGIGQGLTVIHCFAELAGLQLISLGLMQTPETIVTECRRQQPDILGLTVLHDDTEEMLCADIIPQLPKNTRVIVGGPVFAALGQKTLAEKPYRVLNNIGLFLNYLLDLNEKGGLS
jgi:methylmalonyl-CoA mutase cobalamin-binding subunit